VRAGRSGVARIAHLENSSMPVNFGAELKDFDPKQYVRPRKALKVMCREIQVAFAAADLAVQDSGLAGGQADPDRMGSLFGSEMLYGDVHDTADLFAKCEQDNKFQFEKFGQNFPSQMFPLWMLKNLPNMAACHVAIAHDARGPNNTIVLGDVSSLVALIEAMQVIHRDAADVMIVGGMGTRVELTGWIYRADLKLSHRLDDPQAASRPFDLDRDGMVNGEGAAALILESRAHAEQRGANILCTIRGWGNSMASGQVGMDVAIRRSIEQALRTSGANLADLSHVNAHGLSSVEHDVAEATAIHQTVGDVPVTAMKSLFGNLGAGGGAVELVGSILALNDHVVPRTLNYVTPDPYCPVNVVQDEPLERTETLALKLSQSATGQAAAVMVGLPS
jgi:3-oxoacyl-[acyl-carrier-protein] synthase II